MVDAETRPADVVLVGASGAHTCSCRVKWSLPDQCVKYHAMSPFPGHTCSEFFIERTDLSFPVT